MKQLFAFYVIILFPFFFFEYSTVWNKPYLHLIFLLYASLSIYIEKLLKYTIALFYELCKFSLFPTHFIKGQALVKLWEASHFLVFILYLSSKFNNGLCKPLGRYSLIRLWYNFCLTFITFETLWKFLLYKARESI